MSRMRVLFTLTMLLLACVPLLAAPVSQTTAVSAAQRWIAANPAPGVANPVGQVWTLADEIVPLTDVLGKPLAYALALKPAGCVVIAADDAVAPVVFFTTSGTVGGLLAPASPARALMLGDLPGRIAAAANYTATQRATVRSQWYPTRSNVAESSVTIEVPPLLITEWNQDGSRMEPDGAGVSRETYTYNRLSPHHYVTGCVAVAGAQVMRFFNWPPRASGSGVPEDDGSNYDASFNSTYNWEQMPAKLTSASSNMECNEVSRLMYDVGIAVEMDYGPHGSSASTTDLEDVFHDVFGYTGYRTASCGFRTDYVKAQIRSRLPIIMSIRANTFLGTGAGGDGHAIVADGLGTSGGNDVFHLNFGWQGSGNGWYTMPVGVPTAGNSDNWDTLQNMVYNILPPRRAKADIAVGDARYHGFMLGNNIYNTTGVAQGAYATTVPGATTEFLINMQNEGTRVWYMYFKGDAGDAQADIRYYAMPENVDITAAATSPGGWRNSPARPGDIGHIRPGDVKQIKAVVTCGTLSTGQPRSFRVTTWADGEPQTLDAGLLTIERFAAVPNVLVRLPGGTYGDGLVSRTLSTNTAGEYQVAIRNGGLGSESFTVRARLEQPGTDLRVGLVGLGVAPRPAWAWSVFDAAGSDITSALRVGGWPTGVLTPTAQRDLRVVLTPLEPAASGATARLIFEAVPSTGGDSSRDIAAVEAVKQRYDVSIEARPLGSSAPYMDPTPLRIASAGTGLTYVVRVTNRGATPDSFLVYVPELPGWDVMVQAYMAVPFPPSWRNVSMAAHAMGYLLGPLAPGASEDIYVIVQPTASVPDNTIGRVQVQTWANGCGGAFAETELAVLKGQPGVSVLQGPSIGGPWDRLGPSIPAYVGAPARFYVKVENTGTVADTFRLQGGTTATNYTVTYAQVTEFTATPLNVPGGGVITGLLQPGQAFFYRVTMEPFASAPVDARCGVTFTAISQATPTLAAWTTLNAEKGRYGVTLDAQRAGDEAWATTDVSGIAAPAAPATLYARLQNRGGGVDRYRLHGWCNAGGWTIAFSDDNGAAPSINAGTYYTDDVTSLGRRGFTIVATPGAGVPVGSVATIYFQATSANGGGVSQTMQLTLMRTGYDPRVRVRNLGTDTYGAGAGQRITNHQTATYEFEVRNNAAVADIVTVHLVKSSTSGSASTWQAYSPSLSEGMTITDNSFTMAMAAGQATTVTVAVTTDGFLFEGMNCLVTATATSGGDAARTSTAVATTTRAYSSYVLEYWDGSAWIDAYNADFPPLQPNMTALGAVPPASRLYRIRNVGEGPSNYQMVFSHAGAHAGDWAVRFADGAGGADLPLGTGWDTGVLAVGDARVFAMEAVPAAGLPAGDAITGTMTIGGDALTALQSTFQITKATAAVETTIKRAGTEDVFADSASGAVFSVWHAPAAAYLVRVRNTGTAPDTYTIWRTGTIYGGSFTSDVYDRPVGGTAVTGEVLTGQWTVGPLEPGEERVFRLEVAGVDENQAGDSVEFTIHAVSRNVPDVEDDAGAETVQRVFTSVTLEADVASPQNVGTPVTLTASCTGPDPGDVIQYGFQISEVLPGGGYGPWETLVAAQAEPTLVWTPELRGRFELRAMARPIGAEGAVVSMSLPFDVGAPLTGVNANVLPGLVAPTTVPFTFKATPVGGIAPEFRILFKNATDSAYYSISEGGGWHANPATYVGPLPVGKYQVYVQAREQGETRVVQSKVQYLTVRGEITNVAIVGSPASPTAVGQRVVLTAAATGGANPRYRFEAMLDGESTPVFYRDYGTARTTWWTPILPGSYTVKVLVLDNGVDVPRTASMTYIVNPVLTGVTLSMVSPPGSPTAVGVPLNLLAEAQGGGTVEYQYLWNFSLTTRASATWTKLTYGLGRGFTHTPTQVGYYTFRVYARERGSGVTTFQAASTDLKVQVKAPITGYGIQITPNGSGQFTIGVTNVVGAGGNPQWKYWAKRSGGSYALLQDYTANTTLSKWSPTPGTYTVMVYMKEAGSKATAYDLSWTTPYVVP